MKAVAGAIKAPLKALGLVPKMPKAPVAQGPITRDDIKIQSDAEDELRKRLGSRADMVTGAAGAEAGRAATGAATLG
jgi:hypothetical protein